MAKRKELKIVYVPFKEYTDEEIRQAEEDCQKVIDYIYKKIILESFRLYGVTSRNGKNRTINNNEKNGFRSQ